MRHFVAKSICVCTCIMLLLKGNVCAQLYHASHGPEAQALAVAIKEDKLNEMKWNFENRADEFIRNDEIIENNIRIIKEFIEAPHPYKAVDFGAGLTGLYIYNYHYVHNKYGYEQNRKMIGYELIFDQKDEYSDVPETVDDLPTTVVIQDARHTGLPDNFVDEVTINFPSPNLVKPDLISSENEGVFLQLLEEAHRILKVGGHVTMVTEMLSQKESIRDKFSQVHLEPSEFVEIQGRPDIESEYSDKMGMLTYKCVATKVSRTDRYPKGNNPNELVLQSS